MYPFLFSNRKGTRFASTGNLKSRESLLSISQYNLRSRLQSDFKTNKKNNSFYNQASAVRRRPGFPGFQRWMRTKTWMSCGTLLTNGSGTCVYSRVKWHWDIIRFLIDNLPKSVVCISAHFQNETPSFLCRRNNRIKKIVLLHKVPIIQSGSKMRNWHYSNTFTNCDWRNFWKFGQIFCWIRTWTTHSTGLGERGNRICYNGLNRCEIHGRKTVVCDVPGFPTLHPESWLLETNQLMKLILILDSIIS